MATEPGLKTWGDFNKVESSLLFTQYTYESLPNYGSQRMTRIRRIRTKTYKFVGMSRTTAIECANEKRELYNRRFYYWQQRNGFWEMVKTIDNQYRENVASIAIVNTYGGLYDVQIQVNEECIAYVMGSSYDVDQVFNGRFTEWYGGKEVPWHYDDAQDK